jgi:hypothetical protein
VLLRAGKTYDIIFVYIPAAMEVEFRKIMVGSLCQISKPPSKQQAKSGVHANVPSYVKVIDRMLA